MEKIKTDYKPQDFYCFCSSGVDGPSQMALEDLGMFRSVPNCVVFYPSDGVSCERAVELAANYKDMAYIRATRGDTPIVYKNDESFEIGKAKVHKRFRLLSKLFLYFYIYAGPH